MPDPAGASKSSPPERGDEKGGKFECKNEIEEDNCESIHPLALDIRTYDTSGPESEDGNTREANIRGAAEAPERSFVESHDANDTDVANIGPSAMLHEGMKLQDSKLEVISAAANRKALVRTCMEEAVAKKAVGGIAETKLRHYCSVSVQRKAK